MTSPHDQPSGNLDDGGQGSIETALAGQYDFDIGDMLTEAWEKTDGVKLDFNIALSIYGVVYLLFVVAVPYALSGFTLEFSEVANITGTFLNLAFCYPIMAGIMMMGVNRATGRPVDYSAAWQFFAKTLPIFVLMLAMMVMLMLGFILLVIPGIYLSVGYMFALLLVLEKNMTTWEALETSRKAVTHHWFKIFFAVFAMSLIMVVSALPLGIGLFWTLPMFYIFNGLLYKRIFGLGGERLSAYVA
jgi:hypothetical protein